MRPRPDPHPTAARNLGELAQSRRVGLLAAALAGALTMAGPLLAQDPPDAGERLVLLEAARLLKDPDPAVRGEAALVVASSKDASHYPALLAIARDDAQPARLRGLVALGLLGAPGADQVLFPIASEHQGRTTPEGIAAAFALGLLPAEQADGVVTRLLVRIQQSNVRRQRDGLVALLAALGHAPPRNQRLPLQQILDDAANKDQEARGQIVLLLGRIDGGLDEARSRQLIERGSLEERRAAVRVLASRSDDLPPGLLPLFEQLCKRDPDPDVRAQALAGLTRRRHLAAIELAATAMRANTAVEVEQGVRTAQALGGSAMRGAVERHIETTKDPLLRAAMLRGFATTPSAEFATRCLELAGERKQPIALRCEAALLVARAGEPKAAPMLRSLFSEATDPALLESIARAILKLEPKGPELARLHAGPDDEVLLREPARLRALVAAGHPAARRFLLLHLQAEHTTGPERAELLRTWRVATQFAPPSAQLAVLPEPVRSLF